MLRDSVLSEGPFMLLEKGINDWLGEIIWQRHLNCKNSAMVLRILNNAVPTEKI